MINWKRFFIGLLFIFINLAIYVFLGLIILGYEDSYDESKGEYWSLQSMTFGQKAAYIGWYVWYIFNVIAILYFLFKLFKAIRNRYFGEN